MSVFSLFITFVTYIPDDIRKEGTLDLVQPCEIDRQYMAFTRLSGQAMASHQLQVMMCLFVSNRE